MIHLRTKRGIWTIILPTTLTMLLVAISPMIMGADNTKLYAPYIICIYATLGAIMLSTRKESINFLSPNSLVFFYCILSIALGSMALRDELALVSQNVSDYVRHNHTDVALTFLMLGLICLPLVQTVFSDAKEGPPRPIRLDQGRFIVVILTLLPFIVLGFDLSLIGGAGDLSSYLKSLLALSAIIFASRFGMATRYILFVIVLAIMVALNPHDKRLAIFLALPFIYLEFRNKSLDFSLKGFLLVSICLLLLVYAIVVMSIARGYGGFVSNDSLLSAIFFVPEYLESDFFLAAFFQNIEVSYFYFHYVNAIELVYGGFVNLAFGETLAKFLFIPFPRSMIEWKPESIITLYTLAHDPSFREVGGSWPANFAADYFWNFHFFGLFLFPLFAYLNLKLFRYLCSDRVERRPFTTVLALYAFMNILTYARGSGLDLFLFIVLAPGSFLFLGALLHHGLRLVSRSRFRGTA